MSVERNTTKVGTVAGATVLVVCGHAMAQSIPGPGQTVHWTAAMSPITVSNQLTIPDTAMLIIDPGVVVNVVSGGQLVIDGTVRAEGTAGSPVTITGSTNIFSPPIISRSGLLDLAHTDCTALLTTANASSLFSEAATIVVRDCTFSSQGGLYCRWGSVAIYDCEFNSATIDLNDTFIIFDGGTLNNTIFRSDRYHVAQTVHIDGVDASNHPTDSPFHIRGFNYFFGPNNTIQNNLYPVILDGAGIEPGSTLPTSGNTNNHFYMPEPEISGWVTLPNLGIPYVINHDPAESKWLGGTLNIEPGVTVEFMPDAYLWATYSSNIRAMGTPTQPITFKPHIPGTSFLTVNFAINRNRPHARYWNMTGSELGLISDETKTYVDSCTFENNQVGAYVSNYGSLDIKGSTFRNNSVAGVQTSTQTGSVTIDGQWNPSTFENNTYGLQVRNNNNPNAKNNWWGHSSGPNHAIYNPSGQGDAASAGTLVQPWRTTAPQTTNHPPLVKILPIGSLQREGNQIILHWEVEDDGFIATQHLYFADHDGLPLEILVPDIAPDARSVAVTIPDHQPSNLLSAAVFRIVAIDNLGQQGFDERLFGYPISDVPGTVTPTPIAGPLQPGQEVDVCYTVQGASGTTDAYLFIDDVGYAQSLGGAHTGVSCLSLGLDAPAVSTDIARVGIRYNYGNNFYRWEYTPYFSIRPDASVGDAPATVSLTSLTSPATFGSNQIVPIKWTASDDDFVRSVEIHASYDGGTTWSVIAQNIDGSATQYNWKLPLLPNPIDAKVRVLVRDKRFQITSAISAALSLVPEAPCYADCDSNSVLNIFDYICFGNAYSSGQSYADCDGNTTLNIFDYICFGNAYATGCN